jgi:hypothetical protein
MFLNFDFVDSKNSIGFRNAANNVPPLYGGYFFSCFGRHRIIASRRLMIAGF